MSLECIEELAVRGIKEADCGIEGLDEDCLGVGGGYNRRYWTYNKG